MEQVRVGLPAGLVEPGQGLVLLGGRRRRRQEALRLQGGATVLRRRRVAAEERDHAAVSDACEEGPRTPGKAPPWSCSRRATSRWRRRPCRPADGRRWSPLDLRLATTTPLTQCCVSCSAAATPPRRRSRRWRRWSGSGRVDLRVMGAFPHRSGRPVVLVEHVVRELDRLQRVRAPVLLRVLLRVGVLEREAVRSRVLNGAIDVERGAVKMVPLPAAASASVPSMRVTGFVESSCAPLPLPLSV